MKVFLIIFSCLVIFCCCTRQGAQLPSNKGNDNPVQMDMMTYNKLCIEAENNEIQAYLDSSNIDFIKSDAGYWYKIISTENGAKVNSIVTISGTVQVLGGEPCYQLGVRSEASNYVLTLRLGKRDHTKVLDLALKNAHVGDEIWIVSPSSLAYGIKGLKNCITSRTPVLYKIKVLKTNE
ncbi:MAG: FKBP-type peptidyl-prolyl cis-trans isomerase [Paludibacteraceae bacterium]|nr:FKBP-type peptidyl-prolyl cis-trans isomerase [Paludibacteraceae bacterium]MBR6686367.1 FKBP-type peptidyl-prolyl cis-trans isomerase [Paludibacteraceae bacterium]